MSDKILAIIGDVEIVQMKELPPLRGELVNIIRMNSETGNFEAFRDGGWKEVNSSSGKVGGEAIKKEIKECMTCTFWSRYAGGVDAPGECDNSQSPYGGNITTSGFVCDKWKLGR